MYRGKYWNLGLQDPSRLAATDRQLLYLRALYGRDHRGMGLTRQQASDLIDQGLEKRSSEREGLTDIADQLFSHMMKRAVEAANAAGEKWLKENPEALFVLNTADGYVGVHGEIGSAYITAPKKGSGLDKWLRKHRFSDRRAPKALPLEHRFAGRYEGRLQLACCVAALDVFRRAGGETGDIRVVYLADREDANASAA